MPCGSCRQKTAANGGSRDDSLDSNELLSKSSESSLPETLHECAREIGLDALQFTKDLSSAEIENELQREIRFARDMGVSSYPSLGLQHLGILHTISVDYHDHQTMLNQINRIIQKT